MENGVEEVIVESAAEGVKNINLNGTSGKTFFL